MADNATLQCHPRIELYSYLLSLFFHLGFQILFVKDCHKQQLSLCVPLFLGRRPATEWLNGLEYAISYSLASALSETYLNLPALLKGMEVLTERLGMDLPSGSGGPADPGPVGLSYKVECYFSLYIRT